MKTTLKTIDREYGVYEVYCDGKKVGTARFTNVPGEAGHYYLNAQGQIFRADSLPKLRAAVSRRLNTAPAAKMPSDAQFLAALGPCGK